MSRPCLVPYSRLSCERVRWEGTTHCTLESLFGCCGPAERERGDWTLTRHFLSILIFPTRSHSKLHTVSSVMLTRLFPLVLVASQVRANPTNCPAFEPFRCPEENRCISIQVREGGRERGGQGVVTGLCYSIYVMEQQIVPTVTMKMPDSVPQPDGRLLRKLQVSWSLFLPLTAPTTWRNYLVPKPGITCSSSEEWRMWPSLSQVGWSLFSWLANKLLPTFDLFRICNSRWFWSQDVSPQDRCGAPQVGLHGCGEWRYWNVEKPGYQSKYDFFILTSKKVFNF